MIRRVSTGGCTHVAQASPHDSCHVGVRDLYADSSTAHVGSTGHYVPVYSPQEEWRRQGEYYRELFSPLFFHPSSFLLYRQTSFMGFFPSPSCLGNFHFRFLACSSFSGGSSSISAALPSSSSAFLVSYNQTAFPVTSSLGKRERN